MIQRISRGRAGVWAGVLGTLALTGCGKEPTPVAQVTPAVSPPTDPAPPTDPTPPTTPATQSQPTGGGAPGGLIPFTPLPSFPGGGNPPATGPGFVPPSSPTFTPPETLGGGQPPGTPTVPQPPKPADPPPPVKPADRPPTGTPPETPKPTAPAETKYPDKIAGRDLKGWLKELEYTIGPVQKDDQVRETAVKIIPGFGPDARKLAIKPIIEAIRLDPDPGVQVAAITVVSNMGFDMREEVRPVMAVLIARMKAAPTGSIVKMYCVRSLASFGPDAAGCIDVFTQSCLDPSWETRREIAIALSLVGGPPVDAKGIPKKDTGPNMKAVETLINYQLQDRSVTVRMEAVKSLLALGPPYAKTPQEFAKETQKPREEIERVVLFESGKGPKVNARNASPDRGMYAWALLLQVMYDDRKIPDNLKELARLVAEPDGPKADEVRLFALQALGVGGGLLKGLAEKPGAENKAVVEKVVKAVADALKYDESALQYTALQTLVMMGKTADAAIPELQKLVAKGPKKPPADAPKGTPDDDTLPKLAKQTIEVLTGMRKAEDFGKEEPKPGEKKDDVKAAPPKEAEKKDPEKK